MKLYNRISLLFCLVAAVVLTAGMAGCLQAPFKEPIVKSPLVRDNLATGRVSGVAHNGEFVRKGWRVGESGTLTYDLPLMTQGVIEFEASGLSRAAQDTIFLTLFEPNNRRYIEPYITHNPYRATLSTRNFDASPNSTFDFLWTLKAFPESIDSEQRYVVGVPEGVPAYEAVESTGNFPLYPNETHVLRVEWRNGLARFFIDGRLAAEHNYRPLVYNPRQLRVVFGRSPGADVYDLPDLTIHRVLISYPELM